MMSLMIKEMQHQAAVVFDRRYAFHIAIREFMIQVGCAKLLAPGYDRAVELPALFA